MVVAKYWRLQRPIKHSACLQESSCHPGMHDDLMRWKTIWFRLFTTHCSRGSRVFWELDLLTVCLRGAGFALCVAWSETEAIEGRTVTALASARIITRCMEWRREKRSRIVRVKPRDQLSAHVAQPHNKTTTTTTTTTVTAMTHWQGRQEVQRSHLIVKRFQIGNRKLLLP